MEQLNEIGLSRLYTHIQQNRPLGTISGFRYQDDNGKVLTQQENQARNAQIESELRRQNYGFVKVKGAYVEKDAKGNPVEVSEDSFLVIGEQGKGDQLKAVLTILGKRFGQDSILYRDDQGNAQLISTRSDSFVGPIGSTQSLGKFVPTQIGDYYTKLKGNRKFTFDAINEGFGARYNSISDGFEAKYNLGFAGYRALCVIREKFIQENS